MIATFIDTPALGDASGVGTPVIRVNGVVKPYAIYGGFCVLMFICFSNGYEIFASFKVGFLGQVWGIFFAIVVTFCGRLQVLVSGIGTIIGMKRDIGFVVNCFSGFGVFRGNATYTNRFARVVVPMVFQLILFGPFNALRGTFTRPFGQRVMVRAVAGVNWFIVFL